jgi:GT2 family glycosyltransferase
MSQTPEPLVTVVIPSFNQGQFLEDALSSVFNQNIPVEVFVLDGGSSDNTIEIISKWEHRLTGWRSHKDEGQAAAINEGIARGKAKYVCWLNSDDWFLAQGLEKLISVLEKYPEVPMVYGHCLNVIQKSGKQYPVWVESFSERRMAVRCIIAQPATLIRRSVWEAIGGVDATLHMAMDYDLWWRIFKHAGPLYFLDQVVAVNRVHEATKTNTQRARHYKEAIQLVRKHYGSVPWKWWWAQPYAVWFKSLLNNIKAN